MHYLFSKNTHLIDNQQDTTTNFHFHEISQYYSILSMIKPISEIKGNCSIRNP
jgi:hypothetical protein